MHQCYRNRWMIVGWLVAAVVLLGLACGDNGEDGQVLISDGTLDLPQSAIETLASYTFTTDLDVSSAEGDFTARFDGVFQAPNRIHGVLQLGGQLGEAYGNWRAPEMEIIVIGEKAWWREPGGEWQAGFEPGGDSVDPLVTFSSYATPWFYLEALRFEALALPVSGPVETVSGVRAYPVRLDKAAIIDVMRQGTELKVYPDEEADYNPVFPGIGENAQQVLPQDFSVEVWFAEEESYPARIVFDYSIDEGETCALCWGFARPMTLRLQMDITDPDANVQVEPPFPIQTETPTPTTAPGELARGEGGSISEIAAVDPRLEEIAGGRNASISLPFFVWRTSELEVLGGTVHVDFREPFAYEGDWPSIIYDESLDPPFTEVTNQYRVEGVTQLRVLVYLPEMRVVEIRPVDGIVTAGTPPAPSTIPGGTPISPR